MLTEQDFLMKQRRIRMNEQIRVAIIGTGMISHRHMKVWSHVPQVQVVAAAEIDASVLKAWGEQYHFDEKDLYTDFREMLKRDDIDAVDVCVHNNLHAPVSLAVMKAGFDCYCEKPMSASYFDSKLIYDCAKATGRKLAVQISSLFSAQTLIAKKLIEAGKLGEIYHARVSEALWRRRPHVDRAAAACSGAFQDTPMAGHGAIIDTGVYHIGQMLYLLGLPELDSVMGKLYQKVPVGGPAWADNGRYALTHPMGVDEMGVGFANFKNGLSLEIFEANATNVDQPGHSYIEGTNGGLQYSMSDAFGGDWALGMPPFGEIPAFLQPTLKYTGLDEFGFAVTIDYRPYENQQDLKHYAPEMTHWFDNQLHWYHYLTGVLTDETRYDTPKIGLNTSLLAEGLVLSSERGEAVTAEEIKELSRSIAMWHQETPWGIFDYEDSF